VPATRVLWVPAGSLAVGDDDHPDDAADAAAAPQGGMPPPAEGDGGTTPEQAGDVASYNAQTNAAAARLRVVGGTNGATNAGLQLRHAQPAELEAGGSPELEGKEGGARADGVPIGAPPPAPIWR
jgi:hypothetical protein